MKLSAYFAMEPLKLEKLVLQLNARTSRMNIAQITEHEGDSIVTGPAQDVMFIIGEAAHRGEHCLIEVHQPV